MGIGHRVKSINNPDIRVKIIKEFVLENFPAKPLLEYALEVEKITTSKKPNLILNVDGVIACCFVDMLRNCGAFSRYDSYNSCWIMKLKINLIQFILSSEEAQEYINIGAINSLFVLGRSIGFIGHYMDQKRLKQGLYRHPWDDISYVSKILLVIYLKINFNWTFFSRLFLNSLTTRKIAPNWDRNTLKKVDCIDGHDIHTLTTLMKESLERNTMEVSKLIGLDLKMPLWCNYNIITNLWHKFG